MTDIQHAISVSMLAWRIGRKMDMSKNDCALLSVSGMMHDIGKMGLPPALLYKPTALTPDEYHVIQWHTTMGHLMLSSMPDDIHKQAAEVAKMHHERMDGSGYLKLRGEQIPLAAKIVAVADVYDALTANRPYRQAWPAEKAHAYLQENAGKLFDASVVDAFTRSA
jgi:HD-GYP domain-containing protein (c-di-GMP phosphodiesterase class II)